MWRDIWGYIIDLVVIEFIAFLSALGVGFYFKYITNYNLSYVELVAICVLTFVIVVILILWEIWRHYWGEGW